MAATLVRLRWRLIVNLLTRSTWAIIGTVLAVAYGISLVAMLVGGAVALGFEGRAYAGELLATSQVLLVLGWCLAPLFVSGMDSTLDPRAIAAWIAPSRRLSRGLLVAGALGVPGIVSGVALILPAVTWLCAGQPVAALLALVLAPAALATCVLLGRIVVIATSQAASRRGRETMATIGVLLVLSLCAMPYVLQAFGPSHWSALPQVLAGVGAVAGLTPLGWALAAPGYLVGGSPAAAGALALGAVALPVALEPVWHRVVTQVMTGPSQVRTRSRAYDEADRRGGLEPLVWHRRLSSLMPSPAAAVAARLLHDWRSDPRRLMQAVAMVLVPVLMIMGLIGGMRTAMSQTGQGVTMAWGHAPLPVMGLCVLFAFVGAYSLNDDLAMDSTAVWQHLSAGLRGSHDRLGRVVAAALWQTPVMIVMALLGAGYSSGWELLPAVVGLALAVYGCAHAWSCIMSVVLPYETNAPDESPWKSRTSGTAFLAALVQVAGVTVVGLAAAPVIVAAGVVLATGAYAWGWGVLALGALWGLGATWAGIVRGGSLLDARGPRVLATIRSWPGHELTR